METIGTVVSVIFLLCLCNFVNDWKKIKEIEKENPENLEENQEYKDLVVQRKGSVYLCIICIIIYSLIYFTWTQIFIISVFLFSLYGGYVAHKKIKEIEKENPENLEENQEYKKFLKTRKIAVGFCLVTVLCFIFADSSDESKIKKTIKMYNETRYSNVTSFSISFDEIKIDKHGLSAEVIYTIKPKNGDNYQMYASLHKNTSDTLLDKKLNRTLEVGGLSITHEKLLDIGY